MSNNLCAYEVDSTWRIVAANDEICNALRSTPSRLIGRDVRDLIRPDWRSDFRSYVARALVGAGDDTVTVPIVAPGAGEAWFTHTLEPVADNGALNGFRAWLVPHVPKASRIWSKWRSAETHHVWNFEPSVDAG